MARIKTKWHREDIKAELRKRNGSLTALSVKSGLHPSAIANALRRPGDSTRVERLIARELNVPLHELWPERWASSGERLPHKPNGSGIPIPTERQKRQAA
jgi:Ner family transcriptional regulator